MHFFSEMFSKKRAPIEVKTSDMKFPEGKNIEIVRQIVTNYGPIAGLQIKSVVQTKDDTAMTGVPVRVIVRFKTAYPKGTFSTR